MNSLMGYGSDDDLDDFPDSRQVESASPRNYRKPTAGSHNQDDTNYDEVQMSLSEDSDGESKYPPKKSARDREDIHRHSPKSKERDGREDRSSRDRRDEKRHDKDHRYGSRDRSEDGARYRDDDKAKYREDRDEDRGRGSRDEDRIRNKGERFRERDDDKLRDKRDDRRGKSRENYGSRDDRYRKDRDRRRSRSPRDRERRHNSKSPRRSRSRSRDRNVNRGRIGGTGGFSRRFDKGPSRMDRSDKTGVGAPQKPEGGDATVGDDGQSKGRFFMPGITGRFREQIEKRKLLWQKKEPEKQDTVHDRPVTGGGASSTTKVWEATTFAQDTDGKVANKFKRLMGIKSPTDGNNAAIEVLKKQEEMFSSMEQQYEVARTATHTMRGVGLGFGSYPR